MVELNTGDLVLFSSMKSEPDKVGILIEINNHKIFDNDAVGTVMFTDEKTTSFVLLSDLRRANC